jgi:hypothetical protein
MNAVQILSEVAEYGARVELNGENARLIGASKLPHSLKDRLIENKPQIMELMRHDEEANAAGFHILISGEVYEGQYSPTSHVFIQAEAGQWNAWRETWKAGVCKSISYKDIIVGVAFEAALTKAKQYIQNITRGQRRG